MLPTIRPETLVDRFDPRSPRPANSCVMCPDQYGTAAKLIHAAKITASSTGSPRSRHRRPITSPALAITIKNGVSWWLDVEKAKMATIRPSIVSWRRRLAGTDGRSPGMGRVSAARHRSQRLDGAAAVGILAACP